MLRVLAASLLAIVSGASFGQMMGGAMSTSQYFPLVDGARYDYMYTSGPWATSTAVMHSGQTWAGVAGLTAMHTTYVCNAGVTCAPDATVWALKGRLAFALMLATVFLPMTSWAGEWKQSNWVGGSGQTGVWTDQTKFGSAGANVSFATTDWLKVTKTAALHTVCFYEVVIGSFDADVFSVDLFASVFAMLLTDDDVFIFVKRV